MDLTPQPNWSRYATDISHTGAPVRIKLLIAHYMRRKLYCVLLRRTNSTGRAWGVAQASILRVPGKGPHIFTMPMQANDTDFRNRLAKRGYKRLLVALLSARRAKLG